MITASLFETDMVCIDMCWTIQTFLSLGYAHMAVVDSDETPRRIKYSWSWITLMGGL